MTPTDHLILTCYLAGLALVAAGCVLACRRCRRLEAACSGHADDATTFAAAAALQEGRAARSADAAGEEADTARVFARVCRQKAREVLDAAAAEPRPTPTESPATLPLVRLAAVSHGPDAHAEGEQD